MTSEETAYCNLIGTFTSWQWQHRDALLQSGWTKSQVRSLFREFDEALRGIMPLVVAGRFVDVDRRLAVMRRVFDVIASTDGAPVEQVLQ